MTADPGESTLEAPESEALPRPKVSGDSGVEPTSAGSGAQDKDVLKSALREILHEEPELLADLVDPRVDKAFQSTKDRALKLVRNSGPLLELLERHGVKVPEAALQDLTMTELRQEVAELRARLDAPSPRQVRVNEQNAFDSVTTEVLAEFDIPLNDPEVVALARQTTFTPNDPDAVEKWELRLRRLAAKRARQSGVGPSSALPEGSGAPSGARADQRQLRKQYDEELSKIPRGDASRVAALQIKYRRLGLEL